VRSATLATCVLLLSAAALPASPSAAKVPRLAVSALDADLMRGWMWSLDIQGGGRARIGCGEAEDAERRLSDEEVRGIVDIIQREAFFQLPSDAFGPPVIDGPMRILRVTVDAQTHEVDLSHVGPHLSPADRRLAKRALRVWVALEDLFTQCRRGKHRDADDALLQTR